MIFSVQTLINKGYNFIEKGEFSQAVTIFEKALKLDQKNHELLAYAGEAYYLNRQYKEAINIFDKREEYAPRNDPLAPYIQGYRGCILIAQGKEEKGMKLLEQSISKDVKDPELFYTFGMGKMKHHQKNAAKYLKIVNKLDPSFYHKKIRRLMEEI